MPTLGLTSHLPSDSITAKASASFSSLIFSSATSMTHWRAVLSLGGISRVRWNMSTCWGIGISRLPMAVSKLDFPVNRNPANTMQQHGGNFLPGAQWTLLNDFVALPAANVNVLINEVSHKILLETNLWQCQQAQHSQFANCLNNRSNSIFPVGIHLQNCKWTRCIRSVLLMFISIRIDTDRPLVAKPGHQHCWLPARLIRPASANLWLKSKFRFRVLQRRLIATHLHSWISINSAGSSWTTGYFHDSGSASSKLSAAWLNIYCTVLTCTTSQPA